MPMKPPRALWLALALASLPLADRPAHACGPDLPAAMLHRDHAALCTTPALSLSSVLARLTPTSSLRAESKPTADAELADLRVALLDAKLDADSIDARLNTVAAYRQQLEAPARRDEPPLELPEIPEEFRLYLLGARAWHRGDHDQAERRFQAVLALPAAQRRFRSTWAAYMLARLHASGGARCARDDRDFAEVRELAAAGFHDSLGLAAASFGQQAQCWYLAGHTTRALELYLQQLATGDITAEVSIDLALASRFTAAAERQADLDELARHPKIRELVGPWLVADARAQPQWSTLWLIAIERLGLERAVAAGPLAWAAYQAGDMDIAARWAALGARDLDDGDPLARWVLAKLELRDGDIEAAAAALARIELELDRDPHGDLHVFDWRYSSWTGWDGERVSTSAAAELGVLELRRDRFIPALEAFVRARAYVDAAYVAEQLLTLDELGELLDRRPTTIAPFEHELRWLFARRLARAGQHRRALPYYPDDLRAEAEAHADDHDLLSNLALGNVERARLLWRLAERTRERGMELRGTELEPDWMLHDGYFAQGSIWSVRGEDRSPTGPSEAERARYYENRIDDEWRRRYHYRWVAAEYAWQAAELLPDQHHATARVLCLAGNWIEDRDPPGADRFYKALVRRNRAVDVAQWADQARWFPTPEQCSLRGIDFAQPTIAVPIQASQELSRRELVRRAWPLAALFGVFALVGFLLIPTRTKGRPPAPG